MKRMIRLCCVLLTVLILSSNVSCSSFSMGKIKQNETGSIFESITTSTTSQIIEPIPWDQYREISILYPYPPANRDNVDNFTMRMEEVRESVEKKYGIVSFVDLLRFKYTM